jgi:hypothetical protein
MGQCQHQLLNNGGTLTGTARNGMHKIFSMTEMMKAFGIIT